MTVTALRPGDTQPPITLPKGVKGRLALLKRELKRVPKNGWNSFHSFAFATESDVVEAVMDLACEFGLDIATYQKPDTLTLETVTTSMGKPATRATITMILEITNVDDETNQVVREFRDHADDQQDKAIKKAATGAKKYAILTEFMIATGDDPDKDNGAEGHDTGSGRQNGRQQGGNRPRNDAAAGNGRFTPRNAQAPQNGHKDAAARAAEAERVKNEPVTAEQQSLIAGLLTREPWLDDVWDTVIAPTGVPPAKPIEAYTRGDAHAVAKVLRDAANAKKPRAAAAIPPGDRR